MTTSFNATKDKIGYYVEQAAVAGYPEIEVYLMKAAEADATLADRATLATIWAAPSTVNQEANFTNYLKKILPTPTRTVDNINDQVLLGGAAPGTQVQLTWEQAGGTTNNTLVKVLFCYAATSGAATSAVLPLMAIDATTSTDGNDLVVTLHADGFARVVNP